VTWWRPARPGAGGGVPLRPPLAGDGGGARRRRYRPRAGGLVPAADRARDHPSGPGTPLVRDRRPPRGRRPGAPGPAGSVGAPVPAHLAGGRPHALRRRHRLGAGRLARAESVLYNASTALHRQAFVPGDTGAVRRALDAWGVTTVVIPDQS